MEKYNYFFSGHTSIENRIINYAYIDYFINLPVLVHLELANRKTEKLNVYLGASEGKNINESNSGAINTEANNEFKKNGAWVVFAITGIDYFTGNKKLFNIGFRFTKQINHTPLGRMFASVGIKVGIYF